MQSHIEIFFEGQWYPWCQISTMYEFGDSKTAHQMVRDADSKGIRLVCGHGSLAEAQRAVSYILQWRPSLTLRAVEGPCNRVEPDEYQQEGTNAELAALREVEQAARDLEAIAGLVAGRQKANCEIRPDDWLELSHCSNLLNFKLAALDNVRKGN